MPFMEAQLTEKQMWYELDGPRGTEWIPGEIVGDIILPHYEAGDARIPVPFELQDYTENRELYRPAERIMGYGVRLSAPGYLDCTEWEVFTNFKEARKRFHQLERENRGEE